MAEIWMNRTRKVRTFFYLLTREETSFEKPEDAPNYVTEAIPLFMTFIVLEGSVQNLVLNRAVLERILLLYRGKSEWRINDGISSLSAGFCSEMLKILISSGIVTAYIWTYDNFCVINLPWDSAWTWWICFIGVDFGYYWFHRLSHEVNFIWASHQVHHSSEDYNLTTALRQSMIQKYLEAVIYLPLALFIPPGIFIPHVFLNNLYQFWIHTCAVGKLGFVDYILNTPSNHRVHHGRNRYCIDKNYGAVFMVWDHIFGTFEAEKDEVVYGLVSPLNNFDPIYVQLGHFHHVWKSFWEAEGLSHKFSVLLKGPGWTPGEARLGNPNDIPDISAPMPRYDPVIPKWCTVYSFIHFAILIGFYQEFALNHTTLKINVIAMFSLFMFMSLVNIGAILDDKSNSSLLEAIRCIAVVFAYDHFVEPVLASRHLSPIFHQSMNVIYLTSAVLWMIRCKKYFPQQLTKQD